MKIQFAVALFSLAVTAGYAQQDQNKLVKAKLVSTPMPQNISSIHPLKLRVHSLGIPVVDSELPQIPNAAIQVVAPPNGNEYRTVTFFTETLTGTFFVSGIDEEGNRFISSSFTFGPAGAGDTGTTAVISIQDGNLSVTLPAFGSNIFSVEVTHQDGGTIQRLTAVTSGYVPPAQAGPLFSIQDASIANGQLSIQLTGSLSPMATVLAGYGGFGQFKPNSSGGGTATFSAIDTTNIGTGLTTVTVCDLGICGTSTFLINGQ